MDEQKNNHENYQNNAYTGGGLAQQQEEYDNGGLNALLVAADLVSPQPTSNQSSSVNSNLNGGNANNSQENMANGNSMQHGTNANGPGGSPLFHNTSVPQQNSTNGASKAHAGSNNSKSASASYPVNSPYSNTRPIASAQSVTLSRSSQAGSTRVSTSSHPVDMPQQSRPPGQVGPGSIFESIKAQLSPDKASRFEDLFRQLQTNVLSPEGFLSQARGVLGEEQYAFLLELNDKPITPTLPPQQIQQLQIQQLHASQQHHLAQQYATAMGNTGNVPYTANPNKKRVAFDESGSIVAPTAMAGQPITSFDVPGLMSPQPKKLKVEQQLLPGTPMGPPPLPPVPLGGTFRTYNGPVALPGGAVRPQGRPPADNKDDNRTDYSTLGDSVALAGVNLRDEEQALSGATDAMVSYDGIDRSRTQDFLNVGFLAARVNGIIKKYQIQGLDSDFLSYLALATQERLRQLLEQMILASKHRAKSQPSEIIPPVYENTDRSMYKIIVQQDVKKQLLAIANAERDEELKRKEAIQERERKKAGVEGGEGGDAEGEGKAKKRKKQDKEVGPGVAAKNMSEEARKKSTNITASMLTGGKQYGWMTAAIGDSPSNSPANSRPQTPKGEEGSSSPVVKRETSPLSSSRNRGTLNRNRGRGRGSESYAPSLLSLPPSSLGRLSRLGNDGVRKVNIRDALFALERDRGSGGGAGSGQTILARGYVKYLK